MKKIKVLHVVCRLEYGGVESIILNYTKHMNKDKFEFHILTQDKNAQGCIELFEKYGFIVHIISHKRDSILKNVLETLKVMKKGRFDIVHSHMTLTNFYTLAIAKFFGTKITISHSHNSFIVKSKIKGLVYEILKKLNQICATDYFSCGIEAGKFLFGEKNFNSGKVLLMNNAIDLNKFSYNEEIRNKVRQKYGIRGKFCVGHVGRFMNQKNHNYLIDIFEEIKRKNSNSILLLIGTGELLDDIKDKISKKGLNESVIIIPGTNNVNEFYQAMDVFVLPSLWEGFPVVGVEAQASGLKCFLSNNIDRSIKIVDNIELLNIDENVEKWADIIIKNDIYYNRNKAMDTLINNGYDIKTESKKIEDYYITRYKLEYYTK